MAQDSISAVPFFSDYSTKQQARPAKAETEAPEGLFSKSLGNATRSQAAPKVDKPKQGNREPFFPTTPMPYHPEPQAAPPQTAGSTPTDIDDPRQNMEPSADQAFNDSAISGSRSSPMRVREVEREPMEGASMDNAKEFDDKTGVLSSSFDGTAVSYPVSRIARDGLDEKTKESLEEQGLWNLPTMVMAQPTEKVAMMSEAVGSSSVPVQKPIAQFMASLENELGVSPDRLVRAFQKLPPGQMALSPKLTMVQVIKNLNLDGADQAKAMDLYSKMLGQMELLDRKEQVQMAPLMAGGLTTQKLEKQIEAREVASKYSQNSPEAKLGEVSVKNAEKPEGAKPIVVKPESKGDILTGKSVGDAPQIGKGNGMMSVAGLKNNEAQGQNQFSGSQDQSQKQFHGAPRETDSVQVKNDVKLDAKTTMKAEAINGNAKNLATAANFAAIDSGDSGRFQNGTQAAVAGPAAASLAGARQSEGRHEAIQSIINNAQLLAQKGGGEMHLTLKPEHLGEIQLRVAMDGQRVDVQMVAERSEVKKLIEQNVHELRNGLAQHNLSMEKLNVSVSDKNTGGFNQGRSDFGPTREFAQQFHQQQARRQNLTDGLGFREAPRGISARSVPESRMSPRRHMGAGRLDVVA